MKGSIHDRHHSCLRPRAPNTFVLRGTLLASRTTLSVFPNPSPDILFFPMNRSITKELGHDYRGWAIYNDGSTRVVDGETFAGWGVLSRSPHGRIYVMFGLVFTTEAHLTFSGARTHSNNTADMAAMIEAFSFLGYRGPVTHDEQSRLFL